MHTTIRRFAAWLACMAMLFAALAPSVTHAMSAARGDAWTEICSAAGIKRIPVDLAYADPAAADDPAGSAHLEHCPFCATHPVQLDLLPGSASSLPLADGRAGFPSLYFQSPHPLAIWTLAQSRAPPA